ncbi:MAG: anhydro-N-acetylmuramic acid kinase [Bacillota bacterium]
MTFIDAFRAKQKRLIVGLMSGTSADGVDAVLCEITGSGRGLTARVIHMARIEYSPAERGLLLGDLRRLDAEEVCRLNFLIAEVFAEAALKCVEEAGLAPADVDAISSHGQTLTHFPRPDHPVLPVRATLQVGDISVIAQRTGILTVGDFRPADMAQGGQGAPLVPYVDYALLGHESLSRVVQNIGGIGNCTYLPASCSIQDVIAFDTGPGNMVVDALASILTGGRLTMDEDAKMALAGRVDRSLLGKLLDNPYFRMPPPKSTGREDFGVQYARSVLEGAPGLSPEDLMATASELTVATIAGSYRDFILTKGPVDQIIVGGGGARNPYFMRRLQEEFPKVQVMTHEDAGIPDQGKEALAFAVLGNELLMGQPNNVPSATGARKPVVMGKIALP